MCCSVAVIVLLPFYKTISTWKNIQDCCVMVITEKWLNPIIPAEAIELADRTAHRADRTSDSGKSRGGGLCV